MAVSRHLLPRNNAIEKLARQMETSEAARLITKDQIIGVLREHEAGVTTAELCRKHGISDATFYNLKSKYGGMTVSEAARLRTLEDENRRLKKLLAESMLDVSALKDLLGETDPVCIATLRWRS
jgi:putative transposase